MNHVALLIGGNQGDRRALIKQATELIQQSIGTVALASRCYETEPWGDFGEEAPQNFLNRALLVETPLSAHEVLEEALLIEAILGRMRPPQSTTHNPLPATHYPLPTRNYSSRPMDIDLIFFNDEVIDTPDLQIPHPRMHLRRFVLEPLAEIMPEYRHPVLGKTIKEMLDEI
jgi:2-amino-4-hydroxy-6-hydroxymethyldihydropteridine diphosphokinase